MVDHNRRVYATLNGVRLQDVAPLAVIQSIVESPPELDVMTMDTSNSQRFLRMTRKKRDIKIGIVIGCVYDLQTRAQTLDAIAKWARDGVLEVSYRPWQQLYVHVTKAPALGSVREWTQEIEILLTAYSFPFWETRELGEIEVVTTAMSSAGAPVTPAGTVDIEPVEVTVLNTSSDIMSGLTLMAGDTKMIFGGLNVGFGQKLVLAYDHNGLLRIECDGVSKVSCRTPESDDNLLVVPGQQSWLGISADVNACAYFRVKELYR